MMIKSPRLGWLYAFSSIPTSATAAASTAAATTFASHVKFWGNESISRGMYWVDFRWPWLPVLAVTLINSFSPDKSANAISQTTVSNASSWMEMYEFRLRFDWNLFLVRKNNIPALLHQIMACHGPGDKQSFKPISHQFTDAYAARAVWVSWGGGWWVG